MKHAFLRQTSFAKKAALGRYIFRRQVTSLPQVPGVIFLNGEIPEDKLIGQVRHWAANSKALKKQDAFDLLQVAENVGGKAAPRVVCGIWRTRFRLAEEETTLPSMVTLFYRTRDYLNDEFWEDQIRRICDIIGDEYLGSGPGVQLMVHHGAPWAMGLEVGEHRLLAEVEALNFLGSPWRASSHAGAEVIKDESKKVLTERHQLYNVLGEEPTLEESDFQGHYALRIDGQEVCGLEVLGLQPWKVVLGSPWAYDQHASSLAVLADELRRRFRRWGCSLVYDTKDARAIKCRSHQG